MRKRENESPLEVILPLSHDWTTLGTGGGVETFVQMFLQHAGDSNLRVTVLCPGPQEARDQVRFVSVMPRESTEFAFVRHLRRHLRNRSSALPRDAVVLANAEHYAWAFRGTPLPIVLFSHGALPETLRMRHTSPFVRLYETFIERQAVRGATKVALGNSQSRTHYLSRYDGQATGKFADVPIGVDLAELEGRPRTNPLSRLPISATDRVVLFVGRLYPEKNPGMFIRTCDLLRQQGESFHAIIVGDGIQGDFVRESMATRDWLHWIPKLGRPEVLDVIALSRVLVITSRYESSPLVLLEAIGLGTPVISTPVGRASELIESGVGRVVPADPEEFAKALGEVLSWNSDEVKIACNRLRSRIDFATTLKVLVELLREAKSEVTRQFEIHGSGPSTETL